MRPKHADLFSDRLYYCFVNFAETDPRLEKSPEVFVIPSRVVADALKTTHEIWLRNPGKNGHIRKDNPVRRLLPDYTRVCAPERTLYKAGWLNTYRGAWDLIGNHIAKSGEDDK